MTEKEKQIPKLLTNHEYMVKLFNSRLFDIDHKALKVLNLNFYIIKEHLGKKFFHYVVYHKLTLKTNTGLRKRYTILCISFSNHGRRRMYQALELAYQNGFDKGQIIVPKPLWYVEELMAAFYIGVPGDNLLEYVKNGYLNMVIVKRLAHGLSRLHNILSFKKIKLKKHNFSPIFLDPTNVINRSYNKQTQLAKEVIKQFKLLKVIKKKLGKDRHAFAHGDFHPENVIVNKFNNNQLAIIDFSEVCLAPIYYDIASFLQQFEFMTSSYLEPQEYEQAEYIFLSTYFNRQRLDKNIKNKINLYKSWTALKSSVYFMIFEDDANHRFAEQLLTKSEDLSRLIKI